jgi:hypothetical protein
MRDCWVNYNMVESRKLTKMSAWVRVSTAPARHREHLEGVLSQRCSGAFAPLELAGPWRGVSAEIGPRPGSQHAYTA